MVTFVEQIKTLNSTEQMVPILAAIMELDSDAIEARAYIRYLFVKGWHQNAPVKEWSPILNKFYGPGVFELSPKDYVAQTRAKILELFEEDIPDPVEVAPVSKVQYNKIRKKTSVRKAHKETATETPAADDITTSEGYNTLSKRMKKVISIQRGN